MCEPISSAPFCSNTRRCLDEPRTYCRSTSHWPETFTDGAAGGVLRSGARVRNVADPGAQLGIEVGEVGVLIEDFGEQREAGPIVEFFGDGTFDGEGKVEAAVFAGDAGFDAGEARGDGLFEGNESKTRCGRGESGGESGAKVATTVFGGVSADAW